MPSVRLSEPAPTELEALAELLVESHEFLERELNDSTELASYRVRASGLTVLLRHGTSRTDVGVFDEIFGWSFYDPPAGVVTTLGRLGRPPRVLDLGAHIGLSAVYLLGALPGARIVSYEPDHENFAVLARCHEANAIDGWELVAAAASNCDARAPFHAGLGARSRLALDGSPTTEHVTVVDVLPALSQTDLLKLDMEGGEWAILEDERFAGLAPAVVVLEYHPEGCAARRPRAHVESLLTRAGYVTDRLFEKLDGVGMLWAWRP